MRDFLASFWRVPACRMLLACALLAGCASPPADAPQRPAAVRFTILHTNDHHGHFWRGARGEYGLAARKTVIDAVRAEVRSAGGHTLVLDGGDVNTGMPESDAQEAEPDFVGMSLLGYDAMAVGNHEFDNSFEVLQRQQRQWSRFPWLSANIYRDGKRMFTPHRTFALGGLKVAVLGLTTDDTAKMADPRKFPGLSFAAPIEEARRMVPQLRRDADVVVALTHMGHYPDGRHGSNAPGDVELARAVDGIDMVVGGHSHNPVCMLAENMRDEAYQPAGPCAPDRQNGAWIVQAGEWGKFVGRADLEYRDGALRLLKYTLIPVNLPGTAPVAEDRDALALLSPYQARGAAALGAEVGRADAEFDGARAHVRYRPTNLGKMVTMAMREAMQADFAIVNSGALRDSLPAGAITRRDLLKVYPFRGNVVVVNLSGAEVKEYLEAVLSKQPGSGAYAQYSGICVRQVQGHEEILINGRALDPAGRYRMAINSFIGRGGDGYPVLSDHPGYVPAGPSDVDVLREFMRARNVLKSADFASEACA